MARDTKTLLRSSPDYEEYEATHVDALIRDVRSFYTPDV